ncbi:MAG: helix-turn-helix domain-containing protein [Blautia sp.]
MAEKLSVSRQAVSKWESAQSTPDLQKVLRLAEIFGVSTDYLLKDELKSETGTEILEYAAEESSVRSVSMEEANAFMEWRRKTGPTLAGAVALCIISPALLIFLAGLSDSHIGNISENMATGAGISVLLLLVAAAVVIFVSYSIHGQQYEYLEKERIETAYGVTGLVQERKKDYESTFTRGIAAGVTSVFWQLSRCSLPLHSASRTTSSQPPYPSCCFWSPLVSFSSCGSAP